MEGVTSLVSLLHAIYLHLLCTFSEWQTHHGEQGPLVRTKGATDARNTSSVLAPAASGFPDHQALPVPVHLLRL